MKKVGLMGGSFDPVHQQHLAIARQVRTALSLDEVWLIPVFRPVHRVSARTAHEVPVALVIAAEQEADSCQGVFRTADKVMAPQGGQGPEIACLKLGVAVSVLFVTRKG